MQTDVLVFIGHGGFGFDYCISCALNLSDLKSYICKKLFSLNPSSFSLAFSIFPYNKSGNLDTDLDVMHLA
ncbi:hypothetical protein AQUCO_01200010v1 [Aquilegia coerulea]|uniref:Uncharacterized protein n=1 Tax=Aquilegia coerulea TaxID=218851 RepID=A0A2G5E4A7_AQUCA|nr:hypothetical protein AQUCO_01200010v1 [Aquilegia coerulea]